MSQPPEVRSKLPCKTCPWRRDQTARDIPNFDMALAERLCETSPNERGMGPDYTAPQFACHQSGVGNEIVCQGWLASVGHAHPMVRLGVVQGRVDPEALSPGADWPALHGSYPEVLAKLRVTAEPIEPTDEEKRCSGKSSV